LTESPPAAPPRRRVPSIVWGALGAAAALAYGMLVEKLQLGPPLVMIALGGMTLAFTAAALWRVIDPLTRLEAGAAAAERAPRRSRELEREKQLVLKAIKEIELDYQMRKIAERDYRDMVERYRARALRLIGEIEAGDDFRSLIEQELQIRLKLPPAEKAPTATTEATTTTAAESAPGCSGCGAKNDDDAQFCKKCGAKL
jgi:hypothetical protein